LKDNGYSSPENIAHLTNPEMNLDRHKIKQSFATASTTYDKVAALQRSTGLQLLSTFKTENTECSIMDLGCGTGFLSKELLTSIGNTGTCCVFAVDMAFPMLAITRNKLIHTKNLQLVCADAEFLPFCAGKFDWVISNLVFQWCNNPAAVFADIKRVLKTNATLVFSTFGAGTLEELKSAWAQADDYAHVNDFLSENALTSLLLQAGFGTLNIETSVHTSWYASVLELMQELKNLGAHNVMSQRNKALTGKSSMQKMINAYERHRVNGKIPATFEIIKVYAKSQGDSESIHVGEALASTTRLKPLPLY
jgi:malonyl-CoA O-methyltransferase